MLLAIRNCILMQLNFVLFLVAGYMNIINYICYTWVTRVSTGVFPTSIKHLSVYLLSGRSLKFENMPAKCVCAFSSACDSILLHSTVILLDDLDLVLANFWVTYTQ